MLDFSKISISHYKNVFDTTGTDITIKDLISAIKTGDGFIDQINKLRATTDQKKKATIKTKIPCVTFAGSFNPGARQADKQVLSSGLMILDFDHTPEFIELIKSQPPSFVALSFVSPSGDGIKVAVVVNAKYSWLDNFKAFESFFKINFDQVVDPSGKDTSRLCFLSYDPEVYTNTSASALSSQMMKLYLDFAKDEAAPEKTKSNSTTSLPGITENPSSLFDQIQIFTNRKLTYQVGSRNEYIYLFARNCNAAGITKNECIFYVSSTFDYYSEDKNQAHRTIDSAYKRDLQGVAGYFSPMRKNAKPLAPAAADIKSDRKKMKSKNSESSEASDSPRFWYIKKEKDKNGNETERYAFSYTGFKHFMEHHGFFKIKHADMGSDSYSIVRFEGNIITVLKENSVIDFVHDYIISNNLDDQILSMMIANAERYLSMSKLRWLSYRTVNLKRDTAEVAHMYFKNVFVKVTADKITKHEYSELDGHIWATQMKDIEFNAILSEHVHVEGQFERFVDLAIMGNVKSITDREIAKVRSVHSAIGYLCHGYKNPSLTKAVIAVDRKIAHNDEPNGGSGKTMLGNAISHVVNTVDFDGRNTDMSYGFTWETIDLDTKLVHFKDVDPRAKNKQHQFDFAKLFVMLTDSIKINKRRTGYMTIKYSDSPKFYIDTNYILSGEGSSNLRRQHIIEFSDYFNESHSPRDEFKCSFFDDWSIEEWNNFYKFILDCIQTFLKYSLYEFPLENYYERQLITKAGDDFIDFMDDYVDRKLGKRFEKRELINDLLFAYGHYEDKIKRNPKYIGDVVKSYCTSRGYALNAHKDGGRDKANNIEYYTITKKIIQ